MENRRQPSWRETVLSAASTSVLCRGGYPVSSPVSGRLLALLGCRRSRQDLSHHRVDVVTRVLGLLPLLGVAQTALLKPDAVDPVGPSHVQVAGHDDFRVESEVPVFGHLGSTPRTETWNQRDIDKVLAQWPVVDDDEGKSSGGGSSKFDFGLLDEAVAPFVS